jgi:hypothetical protein
VLVASLDNFLLLFQLLHLVVAVGLVPVVVVVTNVIGVKSVRRSLGIVVALL